MFRFHLPYWKRCEIVLRVKARVRGRGRPLTLKTSFSVVKNASLCCILGRNPDNFTKCMREISSGQPLTGLDDAKA